MSVYVAEASEQVGELKKATLKDSPPASPLTKVHHVDADNQGSAVQACETGISEEPLAPSLEMHSEKSKVVSPAALGGP